MIEVLIVIVLLSFGLLGVVGLQARATQTSVSAEDNDRAALLANELATLMWVHNSVNLPIDTMATWVARVGNAAAQGLPRASSEVTVTGKVARITIRWRPPQQANGDERRYTTEVLIP
jgi:type IV pilus assembly protein PilV